MRTPATIMTTPVSTARVNNARLGVVAAVHRVDVGDDRGHGPGGLHGHELRAGHERSAEHAEQVAVEPEHRVDPGQQAPGQPVGHALAAEHDPGDRVLLQRVGPEPSREDASASVVGSGRGRRVRVAAPVAA